MKCIAKTNGKENVTIKHVTWKKGDTKLLMVHDGDLTHNIDGFQFADPDWKVNLNASLLLTNTKMSDIGEYECMVYTTIGHQTAKTDLSVTGENPKTFTILKHWRSLTCKVLLKSELFTYCMFRVF